MKRAAHEEVNKINRLNGGCGSVRAVWQKAHDDHLVKVSATTGDLVWMPVSAFQCISWTDDMAGRTKCTTQKLDNCNGYCNGNRFASQLPPGVTDSMLWAPSSRALPLPLGGRGQRIHEPRMEPSPQRPSRPLQEDSAYEVRSFASCISTAL